MLKIYLLSRTVLLVCFCALTSTGCTILRYTATLSPATLVRASHKSVPTTPGSPREAREALAPVVATAAQDPRVIPGAETSEAKSMAIAILPFRSSIQELSLGDMQVTLANVEESCAGTLENALKELGHKPIRCNTLSEGVRGGAKLAVSGNFEAINSTDMNSPRWGMLLQLTVLDPEDGRIVFNKVYFSLPRDKPFKLFQSPGGRVADTANACLATWIEKLAKDDGLRQVLSGEAKQLEIARGVVGY